MNAKRHRHVRELFLAAITLPPEERAAFLWRECGNDARLRGEVETLIACEAQLDGSIEHIVREAAEYAPPVESIRRLVEQNAEELRMNEQGTPPTPSPREGATPVRSPLFPGAESIHPPERIGRYEVVGKLGEGGMGVVYEAEDTTLGRTVALKFLHPRLVHGVDGVARLGHEARAAASLDHPNICTIYAIDEHDGQTFISMAFVKGVTLEQRIQTGPIMVEDTVDIARQLAKALHHAHEKKVVHRDIKPSNVKITSDGLVKILDFGVAAMIDDSVPASAHSGPTSGTPGYMSPEQIDGSMIDGRADIWALGCILFECLSGQHAFPGKNIFEVLFAAQHRAPRWGMLPNEVPEPLSNIIRHCVAKDARNRYQSARDVANDLDDLLHDIQWERRGAGSADAPELSQVVSADSPADAAITAYREDRITEWTKPRYRLDREFVHLTLLVDQGEETASGRWSAKSGRYQDLGDLLERVDAPALVVLGAPGCGKTTLLKRLELDVAQRGLHGEDDRLTFFIQLNEYKSRDPSQPFPDPESWLAERWSARHPGLPAFKDALQNGQVLLLLDALNEIPTASATELRKAVLIWKTFLDRLVTLHPSTRVVFSCRTLDYSAPLSSPNLRVPQVVVEPLTDEQVEQFLLKQSPEKGERIWTELCDTSQLELLRSPYFLSLLVDQVEATGEIPTGRAGLITGFVRRALRREVERDNLLFAPDTLLTERDVRRVTQWKWKADWELPERGLLVRKLVELAFGMQARNPGGGGSQVRIDVDGAMALIADERDEDVVRAGVALSVLEEDTAQGEILFVHQLTQEYFAARRLAARPEPERVRSSWKAAEMAPSLVELIESIGPGETLPALATTGWEETALLAGAMAKDPAVIVRGLMETQLELSGRCAAQTEVRERLSPELLDELRAALVARSRTPEADVRARIAVGLRLGQLGDPRFERREGRDGDYLRPPLVEIPGGRYRIGDEPFEYMGEVNRSHTPSHDVAIEPFMIGRFPVTNAEWALFMKAGGYEDVRWWETPLAQRWWSGEGTGDGMRATVRYWWERFRNDPEQVEQRWASGQWTEGNYKYWKKRLTMDAAEMEEDLRMRFPGGKLREPAFWHDDRFDNPAQPVVGVCWFEALAYLSWLSAQTGSAYRLPTEAEWEAAARGPGGRAFAWGDAFGPLRCNAAASRVRRTTPVGVFPDGDTPDGISDLAGNVTEWTSSLYGPELDRIEFGYPYRADDGRENLSAEAGVLRVGRGGAWHDVQEFTRSASREASYPASRSFGNGFRVAL